MTKRGHELLNDPIRNRGTGFSQAERQAFGLRGLLPPAVETLEDQVARVFEQITSKPTALESYIFLMALQDQNETLFYRAILDHIDSAMPIIYTPTVGEAALQYGAIFRRPRGLYVTAEDRGRIAEVLHNWSETDVRVIVVTDGSRILGLGDLGANGMTIPIGKLALYTAAGGIPPENTLPIMLDVGTDNESLRDRPTYLGLRRPRLKGDSYLEFLDEFVAAVGKVFPDALLQFEDFATENAIALLARYRDQICAFNDDIQGTAGVTLAGLLAGLRITGGELSEQTLLFVGAGSANTGIADLVADEMVARGLDLEAARGRCWFMDSKGLIVRGRERLKPHTLPYAHPHAEIGDLVTAIEALRPTVLIGATGRRGIFTQEALEAVARVNERPIVFALSNPTSRSEATAEEAYRFTQGRAVFASGSPFDPVTLEGNRTLVPGQSNNVYIFPGIGLGVMACRIRRVTDAMFRAAAAAVAEAVPQERLESGALFPELDTIREVSVAIAVAISRIAFGEGLAEIEEPHDLRAHVESAMYRPSYD